VAEGKNTYELLSHNNKKDETKANGREFWVRLRNGTANRFPVRRRCTSTVRENAENGHARLFTARVMQLCTYNIL